MSADSSGQWPCALTVPPVTVRRRVHHDRGVLIWQVRGQSHFAVGAHTRTVTAGTAVWIPRDLIHEIDVHQNSVVLPMHFTATPTNLPGDRPSAIGVDAELRTAMLLHLQSTTSIIDPMVNSERYVLDLLAERRIIDAGLPMPTSAPARAVAKILSENPGDPRRVEELAAAVHLSTRSLERAFVAETTLTVQEWRTQRRMITAATLLRQGVRPSIVAQRVGYLSASAFRRAFRIRFGENPGAFLNKYAEATV